MTISPSFSQEVDLNKLIPRKQFDFLIGTWNKSDNQELGLTTYRKILKNLVIEQVDKWPKGNESRAFLSLNEKGIWKHSWVDTWNFHLHYEGGLEGDKMILYQTSTYFESDVNQEVHSRQVFSEITKNSFRWDWEISLDSGQTWKFLNGIDYTRVGH